MKPLLSLLVLLQLVSWSFAQRPNARATPPGANATPSPSGQQSALPLFRATLPGGTYEVALRSIIAVTSHEYVVDGLARVTEVNIDTSGSLLARFYYLEPVTPNSPLGIGAATAEQAQRLLQEAADKSGQDVWKKVVKNYPTTTHAHTVEYRMENLDDLNRLFASAEEAFRLQKDTRFKLKAEEGK